MFRDAHPAWCDLDLCDMGDPTLPAYGGAHRSKPIVLDLAPLVIGADRLQVASAALYQSAALWPADTYLVLKTVDQELSMPVQKAAGVLSQLATLVASARD